MLDHIFLSVSDIQRSIRFYYAANVFDPDGYSLGFVYKNWQHSA
jgi:catechol 2,3-dioxygenase-like lactoylglutathione lyase family enzyme